MNFIIHLRDGIFEEDNRAKTAVSMIRDVLWPLGAVDSSEFSADEASAVADILEVCGFKPGSEFEVKR